MLRFLENSTGWQFHHFRATDGGHVIDSYHFSWQYVSNTSLARQFELAGVITPRADERFDGAVDAYCDGHYIGRCEFSSIGANDVRAAAAQIRKRIERRIEERVACENAITH